MTDKEKKQKMGDGKSSPEHCVLCLDKKRSPVLIKCGHSFCCDCFNEYKSYKKYPWAKKCPICRNVLKEERKTTDHVNSHCATNETNNNSSSAVNEQQQQEHTNIFEQFMTLAASYDDVGMNLVANLDDTVPYFSEDDEMYYYNAHYDEDTDSEMADSYEDDLYFYRYSDEQSNDEYEEAAHQHHAHENCYCAGDFNASQESSVVETIDLDEFTQRNWHNNANAVNIPNNNIDWETVIDTDVIIID